MSQQTDKGYSAVTTASSSSQPTLLVFSWGAPDRLGPQIAGLKADPKAVIWIDPLGADKKLPVKIADKAITRVEAAAAKSDGEVELRRYSLPGLFSLGAPTKALKSLMPGLKTRGTLSVATQSIATLSKKIAATKGPLTVLIDTPGSETEALDCLSGKGVLDRVEALALRSGEERFFEDAQDAAGLSAAIQAKGFAAPDIRDDDPDWPEYLFKSDPRARALKELETKVKTLTKERDAAKEAEAKAVDIQRKLAADREALTEARDLASEAQRQLRMTQKQQSALAEEKLMRTEHEQAPLRLDQRRAALAQERAQAEKDALHERFSQVEQERDTLRALLQQLTPKLREAAKQLRKLPASGQAPNLLNEAPAKAETKSKSKKKKRK